MTGNGYAIHGVLRLSCPDRMGIVAGVSAFLFERACNIIESAQFGDPKSSRFFMRVSFSSAGGDFAEMQREFAAVAERFGMQLCFPGRDTGRARGEMHRPWPGTIPDSGAQKGWQVNE